MGLKLKNEELERLSEQDFKSVPKQQIVVVLDNVRSLLNVGSVLRSCDAFLVQEIHLCGLTGTPPSKEIEKTALGASRTVDWRHFSETRQSVEALRQEGFRIYAVEQAQNSIPLQQFIRGTNKVALIFGNEVYGVEQEVVDLCDGVIEIPQYGSKHSLNIAVSAGIVLWELVRGE